MGLQAGKLRSFAVVEEPVYTTESSGQEKISKWQTVFNAYCRVSPISSGEIVSANALTRFVTHSVLVRKQHPWATNLRMKVDGKVLYITGVTEDDDGILTTLLCSENEDVGQ